MGIKDDPRRLALEVMAEGSPAKEGARAITLLLWGAVYPLAEQYSDLDAWANQQCQPRPDGPDRAFWKPQGLETAAARRIVIPTSQSSGSGRSA